MDNWGLSKVYLSKGFGIKQATSYIIALTKNTTEPISVHLKIASKLY